MSGAASRTSSTSNMMANAATSFAAASSPAPVNGIGAMNGHESRPRLRLPHEFKGRARPVSMPPNSNIAVPELPDVGSGGFRSVSRNRMVGSREEHDSSSNSYSMQQQQQQQQMQMQSQSFTQQVLLCEYSIN